jgi:large conductance mechanosensitive channel
MGFLSDFKQFAMRGNILDLAVAVVIGGAFGAIISSMVDDVLTPLILTPAMKAAHVTSLESLTWGPVKYGSFLSAILKFILIAFALFSLTKALTVLRKKEEGKPAEPSASEKLLQEIRDELRKR